MARRHGTGADTVHVVPCGCGSTRTCAPATGCASTTAPTCSASSRTASPTSREAGRSLNDPGGSGSLARVPVRVVQQVIHAAEACPGECIFIEIDPPADADLDVEVDGRIAARVELRPDAA